MGAWQGRTIIALSKRTGVHSSLLTRILASLLDKGKLCLILGAAKSFAQLLVICVEDKGAPELTEITVTLI